MKLDSALRLNGSVPLLKSAQEQKLLFFTDFRIFSLIPVPDIDYVDRLVQHHRQAPPRLPQPAQLTHPLLSVAGARLAECVHP